MYQSQILPPGRHFIISLKVGKGDETLKILSMSSGGHLIFFLVHSYFDMKKHSKYTFSKRVLQSKLFWSVTKTANRVVRWLIETKAAENRRKNPYQSFVISCQISVADLYTFVHKLKINFCYRLSADCRATRIVFLIFAVNSTFFLKNAKTNG